MPFGLSNSPSAYCRLIQMALSRLPPGFAIASLDDVLIYSKTIKEHIFRDKVDYLGHPVSNKSVEDSKNIDTH